MLTDINELWIRYLLLSEQFHYIQHFILFQYISCYSLSATQTGQTYTIYRVSILLMLLFIEVENMPYKDWGKFQYISCYSLSRMRKKKYTVVLCFNTSHVTLYLGNNKIPFSCSLFQYISCYSLSGTKSSIRLVYHVSIHLMLLFISIQRSDSI